MSQFFGHNVQIEIGADILETNSTPVVYFLAIWIVKACGINPLLFEENFLAGSLNSDAILALTFTTNSDSLPLL